MTGGKSNKRGTPQGGVISPLLANLYMNRFLKFWRMRECGAAFRGHLVNFADDFVILSCGHAEEALAWTRATMTRLGLTLNEAKTSIRDARTEGFDFLGYTLGPKFAPLNGRKYPGASPSRKSVQRIKDKIGDLLARGNKAPWPQVRDRLNRLLAVGRPTSATEPAPRPTGQSITMSANAFDASSPSGTRNLDGERRGFPGAISTEDSGSHPSSRTNLGSPPWACREVCRKAGCGKPARPV